MSNFPQGAEKFNSAPYNQEESDYEEINVLVSVVYSKSITMKVPYNCREEKDLYDEFLLTQECTDLANLEARGWNEDNITIIKE